MSKEGKRVNKKKFRYLFYAIAVIIGIILGRNKLLEEEKNVVYKKVNHFNINLEVPENYKYSYLSTGDQYMYSNKRGDFGVSILREDGTNEVPLSEVIDVYREYLEEGSVQQAGGKASWSSSAVSNVEVPIAEVIDINGLQVGYVVAHYDYKLEKKTMNARQETYVIIEGNNFISITFVSSTKDHEKYKDIIEHIASTIQVVN